MNTSAGIHNTGWEFDVKAMVLQKGKHTIDASINLAAVKSIYYGLEIDEFDNLSRQLTANGQRVHVWYLRKAAGIDPLTGSILYFCYDDEGNRYISDELNNAERHIVGQGTPKVLGNFSVAYSYGPWSLSVLCSYGLGHHIYDHVASRNVSYGATDYAIPIAQLDRWTPDNPNATTPFRIRNSSASSLNTLFLYKGNYLKIRNIRLQYAMPSKVVERMRMTNASLFVQAETPLIFSHIPGGYDPELSLDGYRRTDSYPSVSTFTVGLTVNF
jgi:hypothetical protein